MITQKDIKNIVAAGRDVFATKEQLSEVERRLDSRIDALETKLDKRFDQILTAVDAYSQKAETFFQELVMTNHKVERHEKWLHQIAEKLNVKLQY